MKLKITVNREIIIRKMCCLCQKKENNLPSLKNLSCHQENTP